MDFGGVLDVDDFFGLGAGGGDFCQEFVFLVLEELDTVAKGLDVVLDALTGLLALEELRVPELLGDLGALWGSKTVAHG